MTPPMLLALQLLRPAQAVAHRREHEVLEHLDVVGVDDLGRDRAPTAAHRCRSRPTFTMPPPAEPSTVASRERLLRGRHVGLHLLHLLHHLVEFCLRRRPASEVGHLDPWASCAPSCRGGSSSSVAGHFLDDGRAEALGDERHRIYCRGAARPSSTSSVEVDASSSSGGSSSAARSGGPSDAGSASKPSWRDGLELHAAARAAARARRGCCRPPS